uniref:Uncharacterized protein n=1 Tax=viral metagenome TaxID=1070528 RepID=A0A6C0BN47_9ZZZZ
MPVAQFKNGSTDYVDLVKDCDFPAGHDFIKGECLGRQVVAFKVRLSDDQKQHVDQGIMVFFQRYTDSLNTWVCFPSHLSGKGDVGRKFQLAFDSGSRVNDHTVQCIQDLLTAGTDYAANIEVWDGATTQYVTKSAYFSIGHN